MAKILLVEDDNNLREIYEARLLAEGYSILSAMDGEEALAIAVKERPDLIISDVMMPKISGFDMLDILRSTPDIQNTPVIMMTALGQAEDKSRADKLGADKYLVKSQVTLEDVVFSVKSVLEGSETVPTEQPGSSTVMPSPAPQDLNESTPGSNTTPLSTMAPTATMQTSPNTPVEATPSSPVAEQVTPAEQTQPQQVEVTEPFQAPSTEQTQPQQVEVTEPLQASTVEQNRSQSEVIPEPFQVPGADTQTAPTLPIEVNPPSPVGEQATTAERKQSLQVEVSESLQTPLENNPLPNTTNPTQDINHSSQVATSDGPTQEPMAPNSDQPESTPEITLPQVDSNPTEAPSHNNIPIPQNVPANLAQSSAEEGQSIADKISAILTEEVEQQNPAPSEGISGPVPNSSQPIAINVSSPDSTETPAEPQDATSQNPDVQSNGIPTERGDLSQDNSSAPGKKVIQPLNDLNKKPDINELIAKTDETAASQIAPANAIISPSGETTIQSPYASATDSPRNEVIVDPNAPPVAPPPDGQALPSTGTTSPGDIAL